jgi:hypothetical protein
MKKVFLGGTCNNSEWREKLIPFLEIGYFNPVVKNWTSECQAEEIKQRESCDFVLYVITNRMTGVYSVAEAVDDSNKRPEKTIFAVIKEENAEPLFTPHQQKSLDQVGKMIESNGGKRFHSLQEIANYLNSNK